MIRNNRIGTKGPSVFRSPLFKEAATKIFAMNTIINMSVVSKIPRDYGYVVLTGVSSVFLLYWMMYNVVEARKKYNVQYPALYSPDNDKFNCIQRVHLNTLEEYPNFLLMLFTGGLQYPKICASAGMVWIAGKVTYAHFYYDDDINKRDYGNFSCLDIGYLTMLGCTIGFAVRQLGWLPRQCCQR